jgi:dTDP-4-dehydrorhamnose 3,5-epimerase-like enzyme
MKATTFDIAGPILFKMEPYIDNRGVFERQFCKHELEKFGIEFDIK